MIRDRTLRPRFTTTFAACTILALACADGTAPAGDPLLAKNTAGGGGGGSGGVSVSSASPDTASQGTTLEVTINGSGFTSDMEATWLLDGVARPEQVRTNSTRYVSSKKLVANITVSPDATVDRWDVGVMSKGTGKGGIGTEQFEVLNADPAATFIFPSDESGLTVRSDGNAVYSNGVCGVATRIHVTAFSSSSSGDLTLQLKEIKGKNGCVRRITVETPHGTFAISNFNNLPKLQNSTEHLIPLGEEQPRRLLIGGVPGCGRVIFGYNNHPNLGDVAVGSDSLLVKRIAADRWEVRTNPEAGKNKAMCEDANQLIPMSVRFDVVSSFPLPT